MTNRRIFSTIAASAILLVSSCSTGASDSGATGSDVTGSAATKGVIKVAGTGVSFPASYKEGDTLVGFDTDVIAEAAERAGYTVEFTTMDFPGLLGAVSSGRIDTTATNLTWNPERAATYVFSNAYAFDGIGLATAIGNDALDSFDDLNGKTIAAGTGTTNFADTEAWARANGYDVTLRGYDTAQSALQDALIGRVDAIAGPLGATKSQIEFKDLQLKTIGDQITFEQARFPFADTERGRQLAADISASLEAMRTDGTLSEISDEYYGYDRSQGADEPEYTEPATTALTLPEDYADASASPTNG